MVFSSSRFLIILVCIGFLLTAQPYRVSAIRSLDMVFRWGREQEPKSSRILKEVSVIENLHGKSELAPSPSPSMFEAYETSKRRVRRGSDPIHNRS
ncbi:hypothetical protein ACHQM5_006268 [Ranunculus cassubicifolius]